jgi:hypothetical protein
MSAKSSAITIDDGKFSIIFKYFSIIDKNNNCNTLKQSHTQEF